MPFSTGQDERPGDGDEAAAAKDRHTEPVVIRQRYTRAGVIDIAVSLRAGVFVAQLVAGSLVALGLTEAEALVRLCAAVEAAAADER